MVKSSQVIIIFNETFLYASFFTCTYDCYILIAVKIIDIGIDFHVNLLLLILTGKILILVVCFL